MPSTDRKLIQFKCTDDDLRRLDAVRDALAEDRGTPQTRADAFRYLLKSWETTARKKSAKSTG